MYYKDDVNPYFIKTVLALALVAFALAVIVGSAIMCTPAESTDPSVTETTETVEEIMEETTESPILADSNSNSGSNSDSDFLKERVMFSVDETIEEIRVSNLVLFKEVKETINETIATQVVYFDVPLSEDLQDHIFSVCEENGVEPELIIAIIARESTYKASAVGDSGNSLGLMQIQPRWHRERMSELGVSDLLNPYDNVTVGTDYIAELIGKGKGVEWALMAYNGGPGYANDMVAVGAVSEYARTVLNTASGLERG